MQNGGKLCYYYKLDLLLLRETCNLRSKSNTCLGHILTQNNRNVSEWRDISICRLTTLPVSFYYQFQILFVLV